MDTTAAARSTVVVPPGATLHFQGMDVLVDAVSPNGRRLRLRTSGTSGRALERALTPLLPLGASFEVEGSWSRSSGPRRSTPPWTLDLASWSAPVALVPSTDVPEDASLDA